LLFLRTRRRPSSTLCPYTTLFRSEAGGRLAVQRQEIRGRRRAEPQDPARKLPDVLEDHRYRQRKRAERRGHRFRRELVGRHQRRSEEHTSELQSRENLVCRPLLEK